MYTKYVFLRTKHTLKRQKYTLHDSFGKKINDNFSFFLLITKRKETKSGNKWKYFYEEFSGFINFGM